MQKSWQARIEALLSRSGMSTLIDTPITAKHRNGLIEIEMESGQVVSFPVSANPRLAIASEKALGNIEVSPFGIHWPELDEDLSIKGILSGKYA